MSRLEGQIRNFLWSLLVCSTIQVGILGRLIYRGDAGGELMDCILPPCKQQYILWITMSLFVTLAGVAIHILSILKTAETFPTYILEYTSMGVAIVNVLIDVKYAHPIPHAGESLNFLMHSNVSVEKQATTLGIGVFISVAIMGISLLLHRSLTDLSQRRKAEKKKNDATANNDTNKKTS
mmetsp:Transcript_37344/g.42681  ORF Transcript_37344/g.42681 Transcript_37344/m.42681 type:complete len:180 (+) Transcript_37344:134-673(+)